VYTDLKKQSIALFLSEILYYAIQEEEQNKALYQYLETSFLWLDTHAKVANFHLLFLLNLTKFLGFYPEQNQMEQPYFDLVEGRFISKKNVHVVFGDDLLLFKKLLGINFDTLSKTNFSATSRQIILNMLIQYYELHLSGFKKPKSLDILKSVFN
jgi:DNA repair protein RecO (recombination protein O)